MYIHPQTLIFLNTTRCIVYTLTYKVDACSRLQYLDNKLVSFVFRNVEDKRFTLYNFNFTHLNYMISLRRHNDRLTDMNIILS